MEYSIKPNGVCSKNISFKIENMILKDVQFEKGCSGNLQGIARLCEGMNAKEVLLKMKDIKCNSMNSSCPAELAKALELALQNESAVGN